MRGVKLNSPVCVSVRISSAASTTGPCTSISLPGGRQPVVVVEHQSRFDAGIELPGGRAGRRAGEHRHERQRANVRNV